MKFTYEEREIEAVNYVNGYTDYIDAETGELLLQIDADDQIFYKACDVDDDFINFIFDC